MRDIAITSQNISPQLLASTLSGTNNLTDASFELRPRRSYGSPVSLEPAVLVAIVGATGTVAGAAITGLVTFLQRRFQPEKIVIRGKTGRTVELHSGMSEDEMKTIIDLAIRIDLDSIELK
jgi:hypothetical protein